MTAEIIATVFGGFLLLLACAACTRKGRELIIRGLSLITFPRGTQEGDLGTPPAHFTGLKWCPICRSKLELRQVCGRSRLACSRPPCQFVHWDNPKPVVVAVVETPAGIVLVRRKVNPAIGSWCLPGGFMEDGESAEQAAIREVQEETHLDIAIGRLLGAYSPCHSVNEVILVYSATVIGGNLEPGDDADAAQSFGPTELPRDIAFDQHRRIIRDWFGSKAIEPASLTCPNRPEQE